MFLDDLFEMITPRLPRNPHTDGVWDRPSPTGRRHRDLIDVPEYSMNDLMGGGHLFAPPPAPKKPMGLPAPVSQMPLQTYTPGQRMAGSGQVRPAGMTYGGGPSVGPAPGGIFPGPVTGDPLKGPARDPNNPFTDDFQRQLTMMLSPYMSGYGI